MRHLSQKKLHSLVESVVNVVVGIVVSLVTNAYLFPSLGFAITFEQNIIVVAVFTVLSVIRSYSLRRAFNKWHVKLHSSANNV